MVDFLGRNTFRKSEKMEGGGGGGLQHISKDGDGDRTRSSFGFLNMSGTSLNNLTPTRLSWGSEVFSFREDKVKTQAKSRLAPKRSKSISTFGGRSGTTTNLRDGAKFSTFVHGEFVNTRTPNMERSRLREALSFDQTNVESRPNHQQKSTFPFRSLSFYNRQQGQESDGDDDNDEVKPVTVWTANTDDNESLTSCDDSYFAASSLSMEASDNEATSLENSCDISEVGLNPVERYTLEDHADYLLMKMETHGRYWFCDVSDLFGESTIPILVKEYLSPIQFEELQGIYHGLQQSIPSMDPEPLPVRTLVMRIRPDVNCLHIISAVKEALPGSSIFLHQEEGHIRCAVSPHGSTSFVLDAQLCTAKSHFMERQLMLRVYNIQCLSGQLSE